MSGLPDLAELRVMLAACEDDYAEVGHLLRDFHDVELIQLIGACSYIGSMAADIRNERSAARRSL